ncbi:hypothetical protein PACTADRAFT_973 [Pachysolen tannophilus NRRL Y-2460]|uniref:Phosphoribulokinase/uridine kinase domain-containing protein n=1 Tax=Pachysolen tannophilus NRRL Y-2460 TaxID=669874 RepID=A0A1E4U3D9_PACTA|nr:hypothetical protein PACTADRAFT_973 [Pachysolen tannophilus NRRL Y-2460]
MSIVEVSSQFLEQKIDSHFKKSLSPLIIGISGPQGSGKSYLSLNLSEELSRKFPDLTTVAISIDDFYITYEKQLGLAAEYPDNELISGRGLPGTHDLDLLREILFKIRKREKNVIIPRYNKAAFSGKGDRFPEDQWSYLGDKEIDIVILEGWFLGFRSIKDKDQLMEIWNHISLAAKQKYNNIKVENINFLNEKLSQYEKVWDFFDYFIYITTNDINNVYTWRIDQEHNLKLKTNGDVMSDEEVIKFVDRYMPAYELYYNNLEQNGCVESGETDELKKNLKIGIDIDRKIVDIQNL